MNENERQKESNFVSAIIYLHSDSGHVKSFLEMVHDTLNNNFKHFEMICIDDCCAPDVVESVKVFGEQKNGMEMTMIHTGKYQGLEKAMIAGINFSIGDYVFEFDTVYADFEPQIIMDVYRKALGGNDIVSASSSYGARGLSKLFYRIFNQHSNISYPIYTECFRVVSRRAINRINDLNKKIIYRKVAYASSGLKNDRIVFTPKNASVVACSKAENRERWNVGVDALVLFTNIVFNFSLSCSILLSIFSLCVIIYTIGVFILGRPMEGWTTTMLLISVAFLGLFVVLTCLTKYLSLIIRLQVSRKEYTFESVEKVSK